MVIHKQLIGEYTELLQILKIKDNVDHVGLSQQLEFSNLELLLQLELLIILQNNN